MSSYGERRVSKGAIQGVVVYTNETALVTSISETLLNHNKKASQSDYVVIHQTSISDLGEMATASVLDIDMVGASINSVRLSVRKIKDTQSDYPLFLVGKKDDLREIMQDSFVQGNVARTFSKPVLGPQIVTALDLARKQAMPAKELHQSSGNRYGGIIAAAVGLMMVGSVAAWTWNLNGGNQPAAVSGANDQGGFTSVVTAIEHQTAEPASDKAELFGNDALRLLTQARDALKQGYIVGPEEASALFYYRQALGIDPLGDLAMKRRQTVFSELKSEFSSAIQQGKYGRSNSILKVVAELDPFNQELVSMQTRFNSRFSQLN